MRSARHQHLYHGNRRIYAFQCPSCGYWVASDHIEHYANVIRARRNRRHGRYISVRHLRMFIEIVRSQVNWEDAWVSMDELYRIVEHVSQMGNEDSMDLNQVLLAIHDVIDQLETLKLN
jgi:hypothetical protein